MKLFSARKLQVDSAVTRMPLTVRRYRFTGQVMASAGINCYSTIDQHKCMD